MIIYSTGYSGKHNTGKNGKWDAFAAMIERENLVVCDIRLQARSRHPMWRKTTMANALGSKRYVAIPEMGNENYQTGGEFAIRDWQKGLSILASAAAETQRIPLMICACEDSSSCHRSLVAKTLRDLGHTVIEISEWDKSFADYAEAV